VNSHTPDPTFGPSDQRTHEWLSRASDAELLAAFSELPANG